MYYTKKKIIKTLELAQEKINLHAENLGLSRIQKLKKYFYLVQQVLLNKRRVNKQDAEFLINMSVFAVREIETDDEEFAELIYEISGYLEKNITDYLV